MSVRKSTKRWLALSAAVAGVSLFGSKSRGDLTWDPGLNGNSGGAGTWDNVTANWFNGATDVVWDNTGAIFAGTAGGVVTIDPGGVSATGLTFNTTGYTLGGGQLTLTSPAGINLGGTANTAVINSIIAGSAGLSVSNGGTLTLNGVNTYTGDTIISGPTTLKLGNNFAVSTGNVTVNNGATLDINNQNLSIASTTSVISVSGAGVNGNGAIVNSAGGAARGVANVLLTGDTTFGGNGRWDIDVRDAGGNVTGDATLLTSGGPVTLTKTGTNTISLVNLTTDTGLKDVVINSGTMSLEGADGDGNLGDPTAHLIVNSGAQFYLWNLTPTFHKQVIINGGTFQSQAGSNTADGAFTLNGVTNTIDTPAWLTLNGSIGGTGSLIKTGLGGLNITQTSTYSGSTQLNGGIVIVSATNGINQNTGLGVVNTRLSLNGDDQTYTSLNGTFTGSNLSQIDLKNANLTVNDGSFNGQLANVNTLTKNGAGQLTLGGYSNSVSSYVINGGTLRSALGVGQTQGYVHQSLGTGPINLNNNSNLSLNLGGGSGLSASRIAGAFNFFGANQNNVFAVGTVEGGDTQPANANGASDFGLNWANNTTWVYTGQFFFPGNSNGNAVTFAKSFDDSMSVRVDGYLVLNNTVFNQNPIPASNSINLTPGWHNIEVRFGQGVGGVGPRDQFGWVGGQGWGIDLQGRGSTNQANFINPIGSNVGSAILLNSIVPVANYGNDVNVNSSTTIDLTNGAAESRFGNLTLAAGQTVTFTGTNGSNIVPTFAANSTTINDATYTHGGNANLKTGNLNLVNPGTVLNVNSSGSSPVNGLSGLYVDGAASTVGNIGGINVTQGAFGIIGNGGADPLAALAVPINVNGSQAAAAFSSVGVAGTTFNESVVFNAAGQIQHTGLNNDVYNGNITPNGNAIKVNVLSGGLTMSGTTLSAMSFTKTGAGTLTINGGGVVNPGPIQGGFVKFTGGASGGTGAVQLQGGGLSVDGTPAANPGLLMQFYSSAIQGFNNPPNQSLALFPQFIAQQWGFYNSTTNLTVAGLPATVGASLNFDNAAGGNAAAYANLGFTPATNYQVRMTGYFDTTATGSGVYNFGTRSDDGSILYVDGQRVVDNNIAQGMTTRSGTISLSAGKHELVVVHWQNGGGNGLDVMVIPPDSNGNLGGDFAQAAGDASLAIPVSQLTASTTNVLSSGFQDIVVSGTNPSTLATTYAMVANNTNKVTMNPGSTLQIQGAAMRLNNVVFNGAGTYTFAGSTNSANSNDFSLGAVNAQGQTGIVINQNTQGAFGQLVLDTFPAATNAAGAITFQATQGNIVVVGNTGANTDPLGNASNTAGIVLNGGNVLLTTKTAGTVTFDNPFSVAANSVNSQLIAVQAFTGFGSAINGVNDNPASGASTMVVGGANNGLTNNGGTATLGSLGNYTLQIGGRITGTSGNFIVNEGTVVLNNTSTTNLNTYSGNWSVSNVGINFNSIGGNTGGLALFGTNQGLLSLNSSNQVTAGNVYVTGGQLRFANANAVSGSGQIVLTQSGTNSVGVVDSTVANFIPTISTNSTVGIVAVDATFTNTINQSLIGPGNLFLSSVSATPMVAPILPGTGNTYRFSANAYNQNNFTVYTNLSDNGTSAASMQVGTDLSFARVINGGAGSGAVVLMGTNTFSGGINISAGNLTIGTSSSAGNNPITLNVNGITQLNFGSNNVYNPLTLGNTINVNYVNGQTAGTIATASPTVFTGRFVSAAGRTLQLSGINTGNAGMLTYRPTAVSNLGNLTTTGNLIYAAGNTNALPAQNFNIGGGSVFLLDSSEANSISWQDLLANRSGGYNTNLSTVNTWQIGGLNATGAGALAGTGAGDTLTFAGATLGTNGIGQRGGVDLTPTSFFDASFQIGSERIINNHFAAPAPITLAQNTQLSARRFIQIGNAGPGLVGQNAGNVINEFTGGFSDAGQGALEIRSTIVAPNDAYIGEVVFSGTAPNNWTGSTERDIDGGGNVNPFNTGPGGLLIFSQNGNTDAKAAADVFVRFDDNQINPGNINGVGNPSFTEMPTGNSGNLSYLASISYDQNTGGSALNGFRRGYLITGGGTNTESYALPAGYKFIFGRTGGNLQAGGSLGSEGGLAQLQASTVEIFDSTTNTASMGLLVRDGQLTLGAPDGGTGTNAVVFVPLQFNGANNSDTDSGIGGGASTTTLTDSVSQRVLVKRGAGTLVLNNILFGNQAGVTTGTQIAQFTMQLGGGSGLWDGGVLRETNTNSASSSLVGMKTTFAGGVLGLDANNGDFLRTLGTGTGQANLGGAGGGGFAAYGGPHAVTLNTGGGVQFNTGSFIGQFQPLIFGSTDSTDSVTLTNNINLNGQIQNFQVAAGVNNAPGILSGQLTNGGLAIGPVHTEMQTGPGAVGTGAVPAGTLLLTNPNNSYASPTIVSSGGTLKPTVAGALSPNSAIIVNNGGTVDLNSVTSAIGGIGGPGMIANTGGAPIPLTLNQATNTTFHGTLPANITSLTKNGQGNLVISNTAVNYTGPTVINGGVIRLEAANAPSDAGVAYDFAGTNVSGQFVTNIGTLGAAKNAQLTNGASISIGTGPKGDNALSLLNPGEFEPNAGGLNNNGNEYLAINLTTVGTAQKGFDLNPTGASGTNLNNVTYSANAWFNGIQLPSGNRTLFRGNTNDHQILVNNSVGTGGNFLMGAFDNANGGYKNSGYDATSVATGWHMISVVGLAGGTNLSDLYVDGNMVGQIPTKSVTDIFTVGSFSGNNQEFANQIADVSMYNRALSSAELTALYKQGLGLSTSGTNNLLPANTPVTINGGMLALAGVNQTVASIGGAQYSKVTLTGGSRLTTIDSTATTTLAGDISGNGSFIHGGGTTTLSGNNTFSGGLTVNAGATINAASTNALGSGAVTMNGGTLNVLGGTANVTNVAGFGVTGSGWTLNGGPSVAADVLTLTSNVTNQARSAFFNTTQNIANGFTAQFIYTAAGNKVADGATFTIQNASNAATALGGGGGSLGYAGITNSAAIELNMYAPNIVGTRFGSNGATGAPYLATDPVNLGGGDPIRVTLEYSGGTTIAETLTDTANGSTFFTSYTLAQPLSGIVGGNNAFIGFTGATGGSAATQTIGSFVFGNTNVAYTTVSYANNIALAADSTLDAGNGIVATLAGVVSGPGALTKGPQGGTLVLTNNNTYTGGTIINGGTLSVGSDANLGPVTTTATINNGTLLYTAGLTSPRPISLGHLNSTIDVTGSNTVTLTGTLSGSGSLTKGTNAGTLTLAQNGLTLPNLTANGGVVNLGGTSGLSGPVNIGGTLAINNNANVNLVPTATTATRVTNNFINQMSIGTNGLLDLGNHFVQVDNTAMPDSTVRQYLANGYNADNTGIGNWLGRGGITSSDAIKSHNVTQDFHVSIGWVNGAYANDPLIGGSIPGQETLSTNRTLIRPALYGDLNLDGKVDDVDLQIFSGLGQYNQPTDQFGWLGGDLNHDGKVDDTDLQIFSGAGNYNGPEYGKAGTGSGAMHASATPSATPSLTGHTESDGDIVLSASTSAGTPGDGVLDFVYDPSTGHLTLSYDGDPRVTAAQPFQVVRFKSAGGHFVPANFNQTSFGAGVTATTSALNGTASGSNSVPDGYDMGAVLPTGLTVSDLTSDLTLQWNVFGGGLTLKNGDVVVPEPTTLGLIGLGAAGLLARRRRRSSSANAAKQS